MSPRGAPPPDDNPTGLDAEVPHHAGHRDRLRRRLLDAGPDSLADYELLEILLFGGIPRRDVKPLAKRLLAEFGRTPRASRDDLSHWEKERAQ